MAIVAELESISSQDGDGSLAIGIHREVITFSVAGVGLVNYQLKPEESGALIIFASLTGNLVTLPTPVKGLWFEFINELARTSNATKIITTTITTDFLLWSIISASEPVAEGRAEELGKSTKTGRTVVTGSWWVELERRKTRDYYR